MKSSLAILAAASVPLLLSASRASAGEVPFNVPVTDRAQQTQELLSRAAYALNADMSVRAQRDHDVRVANLWIYPTSDANTVFAHYTLTANNNSSAGLSSTQHLDVLTLRGNRIVTQQDLTTAGPSDVANWSAKIGNGHTSSSSDLAVERSQGTPGSPHWSASIGTGQAADVANAANDSAREPAKLARAVVATSTGAHWSSKIGTAHASESDAETTKRRI